MKRLFSLLALGFILLAAAPAQAQETEDGFLSRITIAVPLFTRHTPHDELFNDSTWGAFVFFALDEDWSLTAGDYINSYDKNTAFAGVEWQPIHLHVSRLNIDLGGMLAADLNGGYAHYEPLNPLLGALNVKIGGHYFDDPGLAFFNRLGMLVTVLPGIGSGQSTAINLALTLQL